MAKAERSRSAYRRVIVKVSGEALAGPGGSGIHQPTIDRIAKDIVAARKLGVTLGVVVGGGNILRGVQVTGKGLSRPTADAMGMLATVMNAMVLEAAIERLGVAARTAARAAPSRRKPRRGVRRWHRKSVFYHRHHGGASCCRNGLRCRAEGHQCRRRL
jgi:uridylate kinase